MSKIWPQVKLGDVLRRSKEIIDLRPEAEYRQITVRLWGKGVILRGILTGAQIAASRQTLARRGQFILSRIDARNGAFGIVPDELDKAIVSNDFPVFNLATDRLLPRYLDWRSKTAAFVEECQRASEGTTNRVRLQEDKFLATEIPLPSLSEQQHIVLRIEELAAQVRAAGALRQRSAEETEFLITQASAKVYDWAGKAWGFRRLDDLCRRITDGTHVTPRYAESGVPFLSVKDITTGRISFDNVRLISQEEHAILTKRCKPELGDVLLTKVGTTGFAKAIDVDREFSIFVSLALLKLNRDLVDPKFTEYMLNSDRLREHSAQGTRGVGNKNLVLKFIREFPMPVPSLQEQRRIAGQLDKLRVEVDALKCIQAETSAELDALMPSILNKAFRGEL